MHLKEHSRPADLGNDEVNEVPPVGTGIERRIQVNDCRIVSQNRDSKQERANQKANQPAERTFTLPFASDLEMDQRKLVCQTRAEQEFEMGADTAHGIEF